MSMRIMINGKDIPWESATWSGTENQASRKLDFTVPSNPYDASFQNPTIALGDIVDFYTDNTLLYRGVITGRDRSGDIGTASYQSFDYMHYLLRSNCTKSFKKTTPKKITLQMCKMIGMATTAVADPKVNLKKVVFEDKSLYDIIVAGYRKAYLSKGKKYMPTMVGDKLSVIIKGTDSGVTLEQGKDIISASFHDTTDNMVNIMKIYNEKHKQKGTVKNNDEVIKYGYYQQVYTMQKNEKVGKAKQNAKAELVGITKEASIEALGDLRCIAGRALVIHDSAAGISGMFYISSDSHKFQNDTHTMSLELKWTNTMETGAEYETKK